MTSNGGRRSLYEPLTFVKVNRQRTALPLSPEAESLVNLFSHAYDHSYNLLQDTDDIRCITRALGLSMEAVKAARTARSSQEDTNNNSQSSDNERAELNLNPDDDTSKDTEERAGEDNDNSVRQPPTEVTQPNQNVNDSGASAHTNTSMNYDDDVNSDTTDADSFIAEDSIYTKESSASGDLTDSEYDDDVSEVSLPPLVRS